MQTPHLSVAVEDDAPDADVSFVGDQLDAYNQACVGDPGFARLKIFLRDEQREIRGALLGAFYFGWFYVSVLWIDERHRGGGWGEALLRAAEAEAAARGSRGVWLDTFSFQAPGFYRKLGYEEFARLENFPEGHARLSFLKHLRPAGE